MDYHIALRIDSGLLAMQMLFKLTRLVMCLDGNYRTYQKGMMMQLLILLYQQKHDLPTWEMFTRSVSVFNEEAGEMSFSVLSRVVLGDNLKMKFDHMDKMYKLTRAYSEASEALRVEQDRTARKNWYHLLTDKEVEIFTVSAFMLETIRCIGYNVFTQYPGNVECKNPSYSFATRRTEAYTSETLMWRRFIRLDMQSSMNKYRLACTGTWAKDNNLHRLWPAYDNEARVALLRGQYGALLAAEDAAEVVPSGAAERGDSEPDSPSDWEDGDMDYKHNEDPEAEELKADQDETSALVEQAEADETALVRTARIAGLATANRMYSALSPDRDKSPEPANKRPHE